MVKQYEFYLFSYNYMLGNYFPYKTTGPGNIYPMWNAYCVPNTTLRTLFFKYILLIMLLQMSQFYLTFIPLCPLPLYPPAFLPTLVHVHGWYI